MVLFGRSYDELPSVEKIKRGVSVKKLEYLSPDTTESNGMQFDGTRGEVLNKWLYSPLVCTGWQFYGVKLIEQDSKRRGKVLHSDSANVVVGRGAYAPDGNFSNDLAAVFVRLR